MAWNRPISNTVDATSSSRPSGCGKMPRLRRGLLAGAIVVLGAGLAAWLFMGGEADSRPLQKKDRGHIKEIAPAVAPTNAVPKKPVDPREDYDHEKCYRDERGILRYKSSGCRAYDKTVKTGPTVLLNKQVRRIFKGTANNEIFTLITMNPGESRLVTPDYRDPEYIKRFKESLEQPIEIAEDDHEWDKNVKQAVADTKKDLIARMKKGEKLSDILEDTSKELQRLTAYKDSIDKQVSTIVKDAKGRLSEQDVKDLVGAANKMLTEQGINPISESSFVRWNVRLASKQAKMAEREALKNKENK